MKNETPPMLRSCGTGRDASMQDGTHDSTLSHVIIVENVPCLLRHYLHGLKKLKIMRVSGMVNSDVGRVGTPGILSLPLEHRVKRDWTTLGGTEA
jgi:hypothetical protein